MSSVPLINFPDFSVSSSWNQYIYLKLFLRKPVGLIHRSCTDQLPLPWSVCPNVGALFLPPLTLSAVFFSTIREERSLKPTPSPPKESVYTRRHPCRKSVNIDSAHPAPVAHPAPAATRPENAKMKTAKTAGNDRRRRRRPRRNAGNRPLYPSHPSRPRKVTIEPCRSTRRGRRPNSWRTRRSCGGTRGP